MLVDDPKRILLELAGQHHLTDLMQLATRRFAEGSQVALARIWLLMPPPTGDCMKCRLATSCQNRDLCLQLAASAGRPLNAAKGSWDRLDGEYRRFPLGVCKIGKIAQTGQSIEIRDLPSDQTWVSQAAWLREEGITSFIGHPLIHGGTVLGVFGLFSRVEPPAVCYEWLRMTANHLAAAIANARALEEIDKLKKQLEQEVEYLRQEVQATSFGELLGNSPVLGAVARQIELVAPTDSAVLILGETGTCKEVVARELHGRGRRSDKPLIKVNCAAIPRELYESEFFGHAKGAFTGALRERTGRFELADQGTLFLDEIGEIPLDLQAKLLRVLQEGELERVGEEGTRRVNVRIIAATNRKLRAEAEAGRFRLDLFYRLSVFPIELPPLRDRVEDIEPLAQHFLDRLARQLGRPPLRLTHANLRQLQSYDWPGNVRELQHVLERACIIATDGRLRFDLPAKSTAVERNRLESSPGRILTDAEMRQFEINNIRAALASSKGKIYGDDGAAARLGLKPTTLASRIQALKIREESS